MMLSPRLTLIRSLSLLGFLPNNQLALAVGNYLVKTITQFRWNVKQMKTIGYYVQSTQMEVHDLRFTQLNYSSLSWVQCVDAARC